MSTIPKNIIQPVNKITNNTKIEMKKFRFDFQFEGNIFKLEN